MNYIMGLNALMVSILYSNLKNKSTLTSHHNTFRTQQGNSFYKQHFRDHTSKILHFKWITESLRFITMNKSFNFFKPKILVQELNI